VSGRTFVIRVREAPLRITVEDVQSGRRLVAADLAEAARLMTSCLESPPQDERLAGELRTSIESSRPSR
jgi:hypothetical protein